MGYRQAIAYSYLESFTDIPIVCETASSAFLYQIPFLVALTTSSDCCYLYLVAMLNYKFFAAVFGPESALSFSYVLLLGTQSGHVFYCALKRSAGVDRRGPQSSANVLCCLNQLVLLISQFHGIGSHSMDGIFSLGVGGKLILRIRGDSCHSQTIFS